MGVCQTIMENFDSYRNIFELGLQDALQDFGTPDQPLRKPVEYALTSGGKRIRPLFVFAFAKGIGKQRNLLDSALAIEFIHTSTLIADDLPCMDNDDERRGRPTLHKAFDEASALLASYALIPAAYSRLRLNAKKLKQSGCDPVEIDSAHDLIADIVDKNFGVAGILSGQHQDIFFENKGPDHVLSIMHKKTSSLFEIACCSGWLFGGGDPQGLTVVTEFASHYGILFQIRDDLLDIHQKDEGLNFALLFGEQKAKELLENSYQRCRELLENILSFGLQDCSEIEKLIEQTYFL